jgi:hypothetical protein
MTVVVNNPVAGKLAANYGMFQDNNTQTNAGIGETPPEANVMTFDTTSFANGVSIVGNSRITVSTTGIYNIQFSSQFSRAGGAGFSTIEIWLAKNGTAVPESNTEVNIPQSGGKTVAAWNFLASANSGDYYELYWYSTDAAVEMWYRAAGTDPARPEIPSVILTVSQVA